MVVCVWEGAEGEGREGGGERGHGQKDGRRHRINGFQAQAYACIGRAVSYTLACIPPGSLCTSEFVHSPDTSWKDTITHQPDTSPYGGSGPDLPCYPPLSLATEILFLDFGDTEEALSRASDCIIMRTRSLKARSDSSTIRGTRAP